MRFTTGQLTSAYRHYKRQPFFKDKCVTLTADVFLEERGSAAQIFEACIQAARYAGEEGDAETADDIWSASR